MASNSKRNPKKYKNKKNNKTNKKRVKKVMRGGVDNGIKVGDVVDLLPYIKTTNQKQGYTIDDTKFTKLLYLVTGIYSSNHENRHRNMYNYAKSFLPTTFLASNQELCLVYVGDNKYLEELKESLKFQYNEIVKEIKEEYYQVNAELDKPSGFEAKAPLFTRRDELSKQYDAKYPTIMPEEQITPQFSIITIRKDVIEKPYMSNVYPQPNLNDMVMLYIDKINGSYDDFNEIASSFKITEIPQNPGDKFKIKHDRNTNEIREQKLGDFYIIELSEESKNKVKQKLESNKI